MKNKHVLYLRILLVLTFLVGLVGTAQYFLVYKNRIVDAPLTEPFTKSSTQLKPSENASTNDLVEPSTRSASTSSPDTKVERTAPPIDTVEKPLPEEKLTFQDHLAIQAELRLQSDVTYDGSYHKIGYPLGDVPPHIGVCTDVIIRAFRGLGVDLQKRVHEDMKRHFRSYPRKWKLSKPDTNIDHRRVPNLMTYFKRAGASLKITDNPLDYFAGNIVAWELDTGKGKRMLHIGIVSNYVSEFTSNPLIVHNIGAGPQMNDMLFDHKIIGHYKSETFARE